MDGNQETVRAFPPKATCTTEPGLTKITYDVANTVEWWTLHYLVLFMTSWFFFVNLVILRYDDDFNDDCVLIGSKTTFISNAGYSNKIDLVKMYR